MSGATPQADAGSVFPLIEFRRYIIADGERETFARHFDAYFPESFQQAGAIAYGQFLERDRSDRYTWIRGFRDSASRATANAAFYGGAVWAEHRDAMNRRMLDHTDVRLLQPVSAAHALPLLPAVDPCSEPHGARGVVVAAMCAATAGAVDELAAHLQPMFERACDDGIRAAGLLSTFDGPNSFAPLPVREDGPFLLWLGIAADAAMAQRCIAAFAEPAQHALQAGLLREPMELPQLQPTSRSRLRWRDVDGCQSASGSPSV